MIPQPKHTHTHTHTHAHTHTHCFIVTDTTKTKSPTTVLQRISSKPIDQDTRPGRSKQLTYGPCSHSEKGLAGCDDSSGNKNKSDNFENAKPENFFSPSSVSKWYFSLLLQALRQLDHFRFSQSCNYQQRLNKCTLTHSLSLRWSVRADMNGASQPSFSRRFRVRWQSKLHSECRFYSKQI